MLSMSQAKCAAAHFFDHESVHGIEIILPLRCDSTKQTTNS